MKDYYKIIKKAQDQYIKAYNALGGVYVFVRNFDLGKFHITISCWKNSN